MTPGSVSSSGSWSQCSSEIHILMRAFQSVRGLTEIRREGQKKHERNAKSFSIRDVGEEMLLCVYIFFLKLDLFKRSSGGNNDELMTRISRQL